VRFQVPYRPGELVAVGRSTGARPLEGRLRSAHGPLRLVLRVDRAEFSADGGDLPYVGIEIADADGVVESLADDIVTLVTDGPATLADFGSGAGDRGDLHRRSAPHLLRSRAGRPPRYPADRGGHADGDLLSPRQRLDGSSLLLRRKGTGRALSATDGVGSARREDYSVLAPDGKGAIGTVGRDDADGYGRGRCLNG